MHRKCAKSKRKDTQITKMQKKYSKETQKMAKVLTIHLESQGKFRKIHKFKKWKIMKKWGKTKMAKNAKQIKKIHAPKTPNVRWKRIEKLQRMGILENLTCQKMRQKAENCAVHPPQGDRRGSQERVERKGPGGKPNAHHRGIDGGVELREVRHGVGQLLQGGREARHSARAAPDLRTPRGLAGGSPPPGTDPTPYPTGKGWGVPWPPPHRPDPNHGVPPCASSMLGMGLGECRQVRARRQRLLGMPGGWRTNF